MVEFFRFLGYFTGKGYYTPLEDRDVPKVVGGTLLAVGLYLVIVLSLVPYGIADDAPFGPNGRQLDRLWASVQQHEPPKKI